MLCSILVLSALKGAQSTVTDNDTTLILDYLSKSEEFWSGSPDSAYKYASLAFQLAGKLTRKDLQATSHRYLGIAYMIKGNIELANLHLGKAFEIYVRLGDNYGQAGVLNNFGNVESKLGEFSNALNFYYKALEIREEIGDIVEIVSTMINIGHIFRYYDEKEEALRWFLRAKDKIQEGEFPHWRARVSLHIGRLYLDLFQTDSAFSYLTFAHTAGKQLSLYQVQANASLYLGKLHLQSGRMLLAKDYISEGYDLFHTIDYSPGMSAANLAMAEYFLSVDKLEEAISYANMALDQSFSTADQSIKLKTFEFLHKVYALTGDYKKAYEYARLHQKSRDKVISEYQRSNLLNISLLRHKAEMSEIPEVTSLENKPLSFYAIAVFAILFIIIIGFAINERKQSFKLIRLQEEIKALRKENQDSTSAPSNTAKPIERGRIYRLK